jgi:hypothetical protein
MLQRGMPSEILFLVPVVVIFIAAWWGAIVASRDPAQQDPRHEMARLRDYEAWLRQRLEMAQLEKWDEEMVAHVAEELIATKRELSRRR